MKPKYDVQWTCDGIFVYKDHKQIAEVDSKKEGYAMVRKMKREDWPQWRKKFHEKVLEIFVRSFGVAVSNVMFWVLWKISHHIGIVFWAKDLCLLWFIVACIILWYSLFGKFDEKIY
jgi:hypothetical protein